MIEVAEENWARLGYSRNVPPELHATIQVIDVQLNSSGQGADFSGPFGHEEGREEDGEGEEKAVCLLRGDELSVFESLRCRLLNLLYEARCQRKIS